MESEDVIRCMLLPLAEDWMLLPNVTVAEIIAFVEPETKSENNNIIGVIDWRGASVPIISFEKSCGLALKDNNIRDRIAILYHPDGDVDQPYMGVKLTDIPKSYRAKIKGLVEEEINIERSELIANQLSDDGMRIFIPNLDAMFQLLSEVPR